MRGQALVEFALVLPILLLLILGTLEIGVALIVRAELAHAAREAAISGAADQPQNRRCPTALAALATVYGRHVDRATCRATSGLVSVSAGVDLPLFIPGWDHWPISVTERALVRRGNDRDR